MSVSPIAYLISVPLVDKVIEPLMKNNDSAAAQFFGNFVDGFGAGRGIALVFLFSGILRLIYQMKLMTMRLLNKKIVLKHRLRKLQP